MDGKPLVIESPTADAQPEAPQNGQDAPQPRRPRSRSRTEFQLLGDIQEAYRAMPTDAARKRAWEWITGWLQEEFTEDDGPPMTSDQVAAFLRGPDPQDAIPGA